MKRPLTTIAVVYAAGIILGDNVVCPLKWLFIASALLLVPAVAITRARTPLLMGLVFLIGFTNQNLQTQVISPHDLRTQIGDQAADVVVRGRVAELRQKKQISDQGETIRTL